MANKESIDFKRLLFELSASNPEMIEGILCLDNALGELQALRTKVKDLENDCLLLNNDNNQLRSSFILTKNKINDIEKRVEISNCTAKNNKSKFSDTTKLLIREFGKMQAEFLKLDLGGRHSDSAAAPRQHAWSLVDVDSKDYVWKDNSLHEKRGSDDSTMLQASRSDYRKVCEAIQQCLNNDLPVKVPTIRKQMPKAERVPSTQIYLCIRYLKSRELIRKCRAGTYECLGNSRSFLKSSVTISINDEVLRPAMKKLSDFYQ